MKLLSPLSGLLEEKAKEAEQRADLVRKVLMSHRALGKDNIRDS